MKEKNGHYSTIRQRGFPQTPTVSAETLKSFPAVSRIVRKCLYRIRTDSYLSVRIFTKGNEKRSMYAFSERDGGWTTVREPVPRGLPTFVMKFQLVKKAEPASGGGGKPVLPIRTIPILIPVAAAVAASKDLISERV